MRRMTAATEIENVEPSDYDKMMKLRHPLEYDEKHDELRDYCTCGCGASLPKGKCECGKDMPCGR